MAADQNIILGIKGQDQGALALFEAVQKELKDSAAEQKRLNSELKQYERIANSANKATRNSNGNYKEANKGIRGMRGGVAQLGYQLQDVAVQLQGGQNLGLIIGQQGSQIASVFGAGGIAAGAVISFAALIGTSLVPNLFKSDKALADVGEQMSIVNRIMKLTAEGTGVLTKEFEELSAVSEDLARNALLQSYNAALVAVEQSQKNMVSAAQPMLDILNASFATIISGKTPLQRLREEFDLSGPAAASFISALQQLDKGNVVEGIEGLRTSLDALIDPSSGVTAEFRVMAGEMLALIDQFDDATESTENLRQMLDDLAAGNDLVTDTFVTQQNTINEQIDALSREADQLGMTARAKLIYNAVMDGASPEQLAQMTAIFDRIEAYKQEQEAIKELTKQREEQAKRDQQLIADLAQDRARELAEYKQRLVEQKEAEMLAVEARFQAGAKLAGAMADIFTEGSKEQQAALAIQKGLAVGEAIMNMHRAIANANAVPFPANIAAIANASATGLSAIAGIRKVSFEGGGFTGIGSRTGGIDGKGGFPAILHPNETIIDHAKGQGAPMSVTVNINAVDTKGFDELLYKRRGQLVSIINQAVNNRGRASIA